MLRYSTSYCSVPPVQRSARWLAARGKSPKAPPSQEFGKRSESAYMRPHLRPAILLILNFPSPSFQLVARYPRAEPLLPHAKLGVGGAYVLSTTRSHLCPSRLIQCESSGSPGVARCGGKNGFVRRGARVVFSSGWTSKWVRLVNSVFVLCIRVYPCSSVANWFFFRTPERQPGPAKMGSFSK